MKFLMKPPRQIPGQGQIVLYVRQPNGEVIEYSTSKATAAMLLTLTVRGDET